MWANDKITDKRCNVTVQRTIQYIVYYHTCTTIQTHFFLIKKYIWMNICSMSPPQSSQCISPTQLRHKQAFDMQIYQLLKCLDDGLQPTNLIWLTMDLPEAAQAHQELEAPLLLVGMPVVIATKKKATPVCDGRCTNACGKCLRKRAVQAGERSALALRRGLSGMSPIFKVRARRPHLRSRGC